MVRGVLGDVAAGGPCLFLARVHGKIRVIYVYIYPFYLANRATMKMFVSAAWSVNKPNDCYSSFSSLH